MAVVRSLQIPHEITPSEALSWFQRSIFADIPPYFMTHWKTDKKFFYAGDALLAYEETANHLIVAGEPLIGAGSTGDELYGAFTEYAKRLNKRSAATMWDANGTGRDFLKFLWEQVFASL
jgi:hypothetical protein